MNKLTLLLDKARGGDAAAREQLRRDFAPVAGVCLRASTLNEEERSVEAVLTTERAVPMIDWERWEIVPEVLRADGMEMPENGQVPALDAHDRYSIESIAGAVRGVQVNKGGEITGRIFFARNELGERAMQLYRDGMLTDVSAGYTVQEKTHVPRGEKAVIGGRSYDGPLNVATKWLMREVSFVPIGADAGAKLRAAMDEVTTGDLHGAVNHRQENAMSYKLKDGRVLSLDQIEEERAAGKDVELETGKVYKGYAQAPAEPTKPEAKQRGVEEAEVNDLCRLAGVPDGERAAFLLAVSKGERTVADVRKDLLGRQKNDANTTTNGTRATGGENNDVRSMIDAIPDALAIRAGALSPSGAVLVPGSRKESKTTVHERAAGLATLRPMQIARMYAESLAGRSLTAKSDQEVLRMLGRSGGFNTTSQFPTILENTMNKLVFLGYGYAPITWNLIARELSANDLRQHNLYKTGGFGSLSRIGESGEVPAGDKPDAKKETITPRTFGRTFRVTDDVFINDDLGALTSLPTEMGQAAAYTVQEWVYYTLLSNPTMNETTGALYNSTAVTTAGGHANLAGSGAVVGATSFNTAWGAMAVQKNLNGKPLNIQPDKILVPPSIRGTVLDFLATEYVVTNSNRARNPYFQIAEPVIEPLLQTGVTVETETGLLTANGSATAWYLFASMYPALAVAFYGGNTPNLREERPIGILGTEYEVSLRFGVAATEWRGTYKNPGA